MKYICKQLQCKQKVPETERPEALDSYPHLRDWLRTINLRPELIQVGAPPPHSALCDQTAVSPARLILDLLPLLMKSRLGRLCP